MVHGAAGMFTDLWANSRSHWEAAGPVAAVLTVGYGNRPFEAFVDLLGEHGIRLLADVRSVPFSRAHPVFERSALAVDLPRHGVAYEWMGDRLGGKPLPGRGPIPSTAFANGLRRLACLADARRTAVMCAELRPEHCHRTRLLGAALAARGVEVLHVDERGELVPHRDVVRRITKGQATLDLPDVPAPTIPWSRQ